MSPNLRLVAHATKGHAHELALQRVGDGLTERGLAHTWGPHQGEDRPRASTVGGLQSSFGLEFSHGQVLEDAVLHVLESVVIGVQDSLGLTDVEAVVGLDSPRDLEDGVEPGANPTRLRV